MIVKAVVWNIRGLTSTSKQQEIVNLIRDGGYSICSLIETHVVKEKWWMFVLKFMVIGGGCIMLTVGQDGLE